MPARASARPSSIVCVEPFGARSQLVRVNADVELGEVEAEELDPAAQRGQPPVGDASRRALTEAPVDHGEIGRELARPTA